MRKFEIMRPEGIIPLRGTSYSAGYDFAVPEEVTIEPGEQKTVKLAVCAQMEKDEVLLIFIRSSLGMKKGLILANGTGVIDSDYYGNPSNGGEICVCLKNLSDKSCTIQKGERVAQGIFVKYLTTDDDAAEGKTRTGGIGSTGTI